MIKLSDYATLEKLSFSALATKKKIENVPDEVQVGFLKTLCVEVLDPLCDYFGEGAIRVDSGFRCRELNKLVGGAAHSQHLKGQAMDIRGVGVANGLVFKYLYERLAFDQLIWEFGDDDNPQWIHVSYVLNHNRQEVLRARKNAKGITFYEPFV